MGSTGGSSTGATIAFAGKSAVAAGRLISLSGFTISGVAVEDADLASNVNKMIAGDLISYSAVEARFVYTGDLADDDLEVLNQAVVTIVIPVDDDASPASSSIASTSGAFITSITLPELANNTRAEMTITFQPTNEWAIT